jgi:hypothetical protein
VQPIPWDSKDKEIFAMLDDIYIANKQNPLPMSSNMATLTKLAHHLYLNPPGTRRCFNVEIWLKKGRDVDNLISTLL